MAFRLALAAVTAAIVLGAKPIIELSLGNNVAPHPSVGAAIARAEAGRIFYESGVISDLDAAYKATLADASVALGATISKGLSGRSSFANIVDPTIAVRVVSAPSDDDAGAAAVATLEYKRSASESALVAAAKQEFRALATTVIGEYAKQIKSRKTSFLGQSRMINVKLTTDPSFQTIGGMIDAMESRRAVGESAVRAHILSLEMALVRGLNRIAIAALSGK